MRFWCILACLLAPVQAQRIEVTPVGVLTLVAAGAGWLAGGTLRWSGFRLSLQPDGLGFTPLIQVQGLPALPMEDGRLVWGLTLGGTSLLSQGTRPEFERYEQQHVEGWRSFGMEYLARVLGEACTYDPWSSWGQALGCLADIPQYRRPPITEAFQLRW